MLIMFQRKKLILCEDYFYNLSEFYKYNFCSNSILGIEYNLYF